MSAPREKLRQRIRALLDKSVARGCTEAEALAAAEKAAQLMRDHGVAEADLLIEQAQSGANQQGKSIKAQLWPVVAHCTNTAALLSYGEFGKPVVVFFGLEPGPQIAVYLRAVCERAVDNGVRQFKAGKFYRQRRNLVTKRQAVAEFTQGFVDRLHRRLREIFRPSIDTRMRLLAEQARDARNPDARSIAPRRASDRFMEARETGWRSGGEVQLTHGVGSSAPPKLIGGAS